MSMIFTPGKLISENLKFLSNEPYLSHPGKNKTHAYYLSGARNHFFRLEGFCRLLRESEKGKAYETFYSIFKEAEDRLGKYDFHFQLVNDFEKITTLPDEALSWFRYRLEESGTVLTKFLSNEGWILHHPPKLMEFKKLLIQSPDISERSFKALLGKTMVDYLQKIVKKYSEGKLDPYRIEEGLHEIRRKLRWISIYAQISGGMIQLNKSKKEVGLSACYFDPEITNSSFLKFPDPPAGTAPIQISLPCFTALSWMINYLGELKDRGLKTEALKEWLETKHSYSSDEIQRFLKKVIPGYLPLGELSALAKEKLDVFFLKEAIPDQIADDIQQSYG